MLEVMKLSPDVIIKKSECLDFSTTTATNETAQDYVTAKQQIFPNDNDKKKKIEDKFIEVQLKRTGAAESMTDLMIVGHSVGEVKEEGEEKKKKKRKKKSKKKVKVKNSTLLNINGVIFLSLKLYLFI